MFFGKHLIRGGLIVIGLPGRRFWPPPSRFFALDTLAGWMFVPYLIWVTIASALNFSIWRLEPGARDRPCLIRSPAIPPPFSKARGGWLSAYRTLAVGPGLARRGACRRHAFGVTSRQATA